MKNLVFTFCLFTTAQIFAQNAMIGAIDSKNYSTVQKLTVSGIDVNQPYDIEDQKMTALSYASLRGDVEMVNLLIKKGALVTPIIDSRDALMYAAKGGNKEIIEILLSKGAKVMNESKEGKTARDYAANAGHTDIAVLLESEMQNIVNQAKAKRLKK
ncbi:MAG: ankyrin repeat domain-containing protein [Saprospiraceae bacterium]